MWGCSGVDQMRVRWGIFQKCWVCSETLSQSDKTGTGLSPSESGWTGQIRTFVVFYRPEGGELAKKSASSSKSEVNSELAKKSASYTFPTQRTMNSPKISEFTIYLRKSWSRQYLSELTVPWYLKDELAKNESFKS